jgi:hypothetical protein
LDRTHRQISSFHQSIVLGPPEETLCQRRALVEALGDQACGCGAKVDDWKLWRIDQAIEVTQTFGLQAVDEQELGHALVGGLVGGTQSGAAPGAASFRVVIAAHFPAHREPANRVLRVFPEQTLGLLAFLVLGPSLGTLAGTLEPTPMCAY